VGLKPPALDIDPERTDRAGNLVDQWRGDLRGRGGAKVRASAFACVTEESELRNQGDGPARIQHRQVHLAFIIGKDPKMNDPIREFGRVARAILATDTDEHEQAWANLCHDLDTDLNLGFANALNDGSHEFSLDFVLRLKATAVNRIALSAHQHQLTDPNARVNAQRLRGHVTQFQHLTVFNTWLNECAGHVDHQAEAGIATAPFEKPTNVRG